jgi:hypothetical protein
MSDEIDNPFASPLGASDGGDDGEDSGLRVFYSTIFVGMSSGALQFAAFKGLATVCCLFVYSVLKGAYDPDLWPGFILL